eukprot:CAMPEP_0197247332 /NCGR_PEP_ID=MMETSP1429-20130617/28805_1 /TAXON_ID=49237 /ORGANISM="Chaetoceros  sp., Strain UNC1202" /LENGTH=252 /DNA_ID=CAMNT_0042708219 /DNA_START=76 /DNA_END=834 /DNA_ORIENTATION=+
MKVLLHTVILLLSFSASEGFSPQLTHGATTKLYAKTDEGSFISRQGFMSGSVATIVGIGSVALLPPLESAEARGRATLELQYDRYYPRLETGGKFYANDLKVAIERSDWAAIKAATSDPPKRSKADKAKVDGGVAERASQAGGFSNARVVAAADLWAASFSDNSISPKTKKMKEQTAILAEVVEGMNTAAKLALGEEKASGGFLGFGAKAPSQAELAKEVRELYMKGGNAYNQYVFLSNDELPIQLKRLPYL